MDFLCGPLNNNEQQQKNDVFCAVCAEATWREQMRLREYWVLKRQSGKVGAWCKTSSRLESRVQLSIETSTANKNVNTEAENIDEDTADYEDLLRAVVNIEVRELTIAL